MTLSSWLRRAAQHRSSNSHLLKENASRLGGVSFCSEISVTQSFSPAHSAAPTVCGAVRPLSNPAGSDRVRLAPWFSSTTRRCGLRFSSRLRSLAGRHREDRWCTSLPILLSYCQAPREGRNPCWSGQAGAPLRRYLCPSIRLEGLSRKIDRRLLSHHKPTQAAKAWFPRWKM